MSKGSANPTSTAVKRRRFGDRWNGRRLRSLDPIMQLIPYIMKRRCDSVNVLRMETDIHEAEKYIRQKRVEGLQGFGMLHFILACYVRAVSQRPGANRFVAGRRIFARNNITVVFTMKKEMSMDGQETTVKMVFEPTDTADIVYRKVQAEVEKARQEGDSNDTDNASRIVTSLPRFLLRFTIGLFSWMDFHRIMPKIIDRASPFHCSLFCAELGSIFLPALQHHLYEFGNCPLFLTIGRKFKKVVLDKEGKPIERRYVDLQMSIDERIVDGYYMASIYRMFFDLCANPQQLDSPPETVVEDVE